MFNPVFIMMACYFFHFSERYPKSVFGLYFTGFDYGLVFVFIVCHLTGISHSSGYPHFRKDVHLYQDVNTKENKNINHFLHVWPPV